MLIVKTFLNKMDQSSWENYSSFQSLC